MTSLQPTGNTHKAREYRVLTKSPDAYYVNGTQRPNVPAFPDPSISVSLDSVSKIGTPGTVERRLCHFIIDEKAWGAAKVLREYQKYLIQC